MATNDPDSPISAHPSPAESASSEATMKDELRDLDISDDEGALVKGGVPKVYDGG